MLRPKGVNLHYEVELGLVMGKTLRDFDEKDEQGAIDAIESTSPLFPFSTEEHEKQQRLQKPQATFSQST